MRGRLWRGSRVSVALVRVSVAPVAFRDPRPSGAGTGVPVAPVRRVYVLARLPSEGDEPPNVSTKIPPGPHNRASARCTDRRPRLQSDARRATDGKAAPSGPMNPPTASAT
jgi:hypothetical protein